MKTTGKDVFTALYQAFRKLDTIKPPEEPDLTASRVEIEVYEERLKKVKAEIEGTLDEGAKLLDRFVDTRVRKVIAKMQYDKEL